MSEQTMNEDDMPDEDQALTVKLEHQRLEEEWAKISERILLEAEVLLEHEIAQFGEPIQRPSATRARLTAAVARWLDEQKRGHRQ
jgi:hypothetical protein